MKQQQQQFPNVAWLVASILLIVCTTVSCYATVSDDINAKDTATVVEELPKPEAYRDNRRPLSRPSYDPRDAYHGLKTNRDPQDEIREEFELDGSPGLEERLRKVLLERQGSAAIQRFHNTDEEYEGSASSHGGYGGYGGYGTDSNYGLTCTSGYVNASAVALLAFLFLLNIVQDVITQITMGRKKRDAEEEDSPLQQYLRDGGLEALYEDLPNVLLPLMIKLSDARSSGCIHRPLCEANMVLSKSHGEVGRVVASLVSNMAAKTYSGANASNFDDAIAAARAGRAGSCDTITICPRGNSKVSWKFGQKDKTKDETNSLK